MNSCAAPSHGGFTLVETLIAAVVGSVMLAAIVFGAVSLQRTFTRTGEAFRATADEMLLSDYLASDLRAALSVNVTANGNNQTLALTLPDYLDPATRTPRLPTLKSSVPRFGMPAGTATYGSTAAPIAVTYSVSNGRLVRTVANTSSVLSKSLENFEFSATDRDVAVDVAVRFNSKFARQSTGANPPAVAVSESIYFRNEPRN